MIGTGTVYLLYDILLYLVALPLLPFHMLVLLLRGRARQGVRERFGFFPRGRFSALRGRKVLWIHAVSVGETRAAIPLVKGLKHRFPEYALVMSNMTETGRKAAEGIAEIDLRIYFPYDFSWVMERVFRRLAPDLAVIVETEIWPNFMRCADRRGIPVVLVNGRISDRSFPRYRRLRFFIQPIIRQFALACMQSELDAQRFVSMGAPEGRVKVTRNLKFDMQAGNLNREQAGDLRRKFRLSAGCKVWVAASTHAGEEEQVLETFQRLLREGCELVLVLVPRHPERCRAVGEMLDSRHLPFVLRSAIDRESTDLAPGTVLIVDSIGEVLKFYAVADLVFVGGSLVPVGGHNVLEASLMGRPVLFGPHMHNFKEISRLLIEAQGGVSVSGVEELYQRAAGLLADPEAGRSMGARGRALLEENRGATEHTLQAIQELLEKP